ncbi:Hypothetical predicted protein [Scomber scombrus]|uniref:Uncharacterized protein n=1 Tax=Scomber scombrus TaxID=13677 RepID=A0AAV1P9X3_SCOSC
MMEIYMIHRKATDRNTMLRVDCFPSQKNPLSENIPTSRLRRRRRRVCDTEEEFDDKASDVAIRSAEREYKRNIRRINRFTEKKPRSRGAESSNRKQLPKKETHTPDLEKYVL